MHTVKHTNIVLDERLVEKCTQITALKTKRAEVEYHSTAQSEYLELALQLDCLIAVTAIENNLPLLHQDRDFAPIVKHFSLYRICYKLILTNRFMLTAIKKAFFLNTLALVH